MPKFRFEQLLGLYRTIDFDPEGDQGSLNLVTAEQLTDLQLIESDASAGDDANLSVIDDPSLLAVGQKVRVRVGPPRISLGLLARSVDDLLKTPEGRITEPTAYFIVDGRIERQSTPTPTTIAAYRKVLAVVALFSKAAAFLDRTRQELVFVHEGKVVLPVRYDIAALNRISQAEIDALLENFKDDVHQDQKFAILENAIVQMVEAQPSVQRFTYVLSNLDALTERVRQGYRLFASSFSYTKIRGEVEAAKVDYVAKIHKTLIDIQGQLLGIPVATIIVASQLKSNQACGVDFWTDIAILAGAWVFLALLIIAIINQWVTLGAIDEDIKAQRQRLEKDYAAISSQFVSIFQGLVNRVSWHRKALGAIGTIAVIGAFFATFAFSQLNTAPFSCLIGAKPITGNLSKPVTLPAIPASSNQANQNKSAVPVPNPKTP
jgi:hypothetical protein